jgi:pimeloyl-ACP methyl ester carboxylesterase
VRRALAAVLALLFLGASGAGAEPPRPEPLAPAPVHFAKDFPRLTDSQWKFPLGGFGGARRRAPRHHVPVIFVHGNNTDAADWYPVRDDFKAAGWTDQELFALSYNGIGGNNGTALTRDNPQSTDEHRGNAGVGAITSNEVNVADVYAFIKAVRAYTGSTTFSLVTHSLGVTLARRTLKIHRELRRDLVAFVAISGANHGTDFCPPGSEDQVPSCNEIAAGTPWLAALNGPNGQDETYGPAKWLVVYEGTGLLDIAYVGPTYASSPLLRGATAHAFPRTYHNDLRIRPDIVRDYRGFLERAERGVRR